MNVFNPIAEPFVPPAPIPRRRANIPGFFEVVRTIMRNPLELWGEPSYEDRWIGTKFLNERSLIVNDPGLIRHVLVENAANYKMGVIRQLILRPILRDGLLTAEGEVWRRSRKAMAPVFTPRQVFGFAETMLACTEAYATHYGEAARTGATRDIARDMTELTFDILSQTLFSGEIVTASGDFASDVENLLHTMGRVDPFDLIKAPPWVPRLTRIKGAKVMKLFRGIVDDTIAKRKGKMTKGADVPDDFLTLLLRQERADGLTREEINDNIITFIGAGHETTARALGWAIYCLANSPSDLRDLENEIDAFFASEIPAPHLWLDRLPKTRAAFEEAMRLYPPAPSINRAAIEDDRYEDLEIKAGTTILMMPWTLHRHRKLWDRPTAFIPSRFWPENRENIDRFQYLPFGVGPRVCIGASFALQEAVIALALLLHRFRFHCTPACKPWPVQKLTTQPDGGLPMTVIFRNVRESPSAASP
ncbi:MAG: cytochrome P450 [Rhizobiales bacterium]|nr:cytochrome P450 [Hyphomicrobiales bacterium]